MKLREYKVKLERLKPGELICEHSYPNNDGLLTKFGGEPDWIQGQETLKCPHCNTEMSFVGQIDSFEHDYKTNPLRVDAIKGDQHFMFGDVGRIYVFFCFECCEPKAILQCY